MGFFVLLMVIYIFWLIKSKSKLKKDINERNKNVIDLSIRVNDLQDKNNKLSKYEPILNAEEKASEILKQANKDAELQKSRYKLILSVASFNAEKIEAEAKATKKKANDEANGLKKKYENILSDATIQAGKIIENANKRADEIAGNAFKALNNSESLEKTAQAMQNIIDGYGDKYIIPSYGFIDTLANDFGYTEAGEELKKARERTRLMIKNGTAAKCDYVELNRKTTAISFVTDAFNGKVDSILSTVKYDNYGTLKQKIVDSFQVVNNLGKAFRDATITEEYLNSRLEELKWAVAVNELKLKEKEEQRQIKEQMREEEKARREYEKAMKEAAKEEELLKKLMEKAQKELSEANEQQKSKYEQQLKELEEKLKMAEEKNQRAISMSQQTRAGHIYIISNIGSFGEDVFKIGMTRRLEPIERIKELGDASVPFSFDVHAMIYSEDAPKLETELHKKFARNQVNKVNLKKEFFKVNLCEIKQELERQGIITKWTIVAEAKEYKESLSIEKSYSNEELEVAN